MGHDELRDLTDAYVLDVLPEHERRTYEAHLTTCTECTEAVREGLRLAAALAQVVEQREPPAHLRRKVLETTRRSEPLAWKGAAPPRRGMAPALTVAAALTAVALGVYAATVRGDVTRLRAELEQVQARAVSAERELVHLREAAQSGERARVVLAATDVSQVVLRGQGAAPNAHGRALWSRSAGLLFSASNLPALPGGRTYQLWIVTKSRPLSAGLLTVDSRGRANLVADMPQTAEPVQIALTNEPAGGVAAPTGEVVLAGDVSPSL